MYQTCLMRACVRRLLSGLYQLFDLCLIKHVLTVWPLTSTLACLVTKQCLMVFGRQTFPVCPGPNTSNIDPISAILTSAKLFLRVEWNEIFRTRPDKFTSKKLIFEPLPEYPDRHSVNTRSTFDQQSVDSRLSVNRLISTDWKVVDCRPTCRWNVDRVSTEV